MPPKLEYTLEAVNQRLKDGQVKARLFLRGKMIWMKATLPPKPLSDRPKPYQQAISTGLPANEGGFKKAENEAKLLSALIVEEKFDWSQYIDSDRLPENRTARSWSMNSRNIISRLIHCLRKRGEPIIKRFTDGWIKTVP